jgi:hypothetical protein
LKVATQHGSLTEERWARFSVDQQVLMIGNEMHRGRKLLAAGERTSLTNCYERVLRLVDLTVGVQARRGLRRELLRWRDVVAELYLAEQPALAEHDAALRGLLLLTPAASLQIPFVLGAPGELLRT